MVSDAHFCGFIKGGKEWKEKRVEKRVDIGRSGALARS